MKTYEVTREIYNPCAGKYIFDRQFFNDEVSTDNIEETIKKWIGRELPEYDKKVYDDGSVEYVLYLPRKERYTFSA